jgi:hypothetical protein
LPFVAVITATPSDLAFIVALLSSFAFSVTLATDLSLLTQLNPVPSPEMETVFHSNTFGKYSSCPAAQPDNNLYCILIYLRLSFDIFVDFPGGFCFNAHLYEKMTSPHTCSEALKSAKTEWISGSFNMI